MQHLRDSFIKIFKKTKLHHAQKDCHQDNLLQFYKRSCLNIVASICFHKQVMNRLKLNHGN